MGLKCITICAKGAVMQKNECLEVFNESEIFKGDFVVINERGLHTRPSTELVKCAIRYKYADIKLSNARGVIADAKSLLSTLMLAAAKGTSVHIEAQGKDALLAIEELKSLAAKKFNVDY